MFIPFAVYPAALYYNKDLFDEAGLAYPPHKYGEKYADGSDWTFDKVKELGKILTVDKDGNDATMEGFDPENIEQFGYDLQWQDIRADWSYIGAGSFVAADGKTAEMPDVWREAAQWYYDGMWKDYFIPNDNYVNSDLLAQGNPFAAGRLADEPQQNLVHLLLGRREELGCGGPANLQRQGHIRSERRHLRHSEGQQEPRGGFRGLDFDAG